MVENNPSLATDLYYLRSDSNYFVMEIFIVLLFLLCVTVWLFFREVNRDRNLEVLKILNQNRKHFKKFRRQLETIAKCMAAENSMSITNMTYADYLGWLDSQYSDAEFENVELLLKSRRGLRLSDKRLWKLMHGIVDDIMLIKYCVFILEEDVPPNVVNF